MLRESHTIAKTLPAALLLLPLLAVWLVLAPLGADAFNFGRHKKADPAPATGQPQATQEPAEVSAPTTGAGASGHAKISPAQPAPLTKSEVKSASPGEKTRVVQPETSKAIHRKDFSGQFSFVLPEGWRTYQIPYQIHDVLSLREKDNMVATISFSDELGTNNLDKLKDRTVENGKKILKKYELVEAKVLTLPGGQPCARIVSFEEIDEVDARQVQYIVSLKKKHFLVATLTVTRPVGEKYDKLVQEVVASISTDPVPDKTTK